MCQLISFISGGTINQLWFTLIAVGRWHFYIIAYFMKNFQIYKTSKWFCINHYHFRRKLLSFRRSCKYFYCLIIHHSPCCRYILNYKFRLVPFLPSGVSWILIGEENWLCIDDWSPGSVINQQHFNSDSQHYPLSTTYMVSTALPNC